MRRSYEDKNRGFSLMELIIAIAVLVILTGLLAPQFFKYIERARKAKCLNNMDVVKTEYQLRLIDADKEITLQEVLEEIEPKCPSGGIYSVVEVKKDWFDIACSKHGRSEGDAVSSELVVAKAQTALNEMRQFLGLTADEILDIKDWKTIIGESRQVFSNDLFRKYLITKNYNGKWPKFDSDILRKNGFKEETNLYIQPYMDCYNKEWSGVGESNVIVFASVNPTAGGNWNASLIFHPTENQWYKSPGNGAIGIANKNWDTIWGEMEEGGWAPIRIDK